MISGECGYRFLDYFYLGVKVLYLKLQWHCCRSYLLYCGQQGLLCWGEISTLWILLSKVETRIQCLSFPWNQGIGVDLDCASQTLFLAPWPPVLILCLSWNYCKPANNLSCLNALVDLVACNLKMWLIRLPTYDKSPKMFRGMMWSKLKLKVWSKLK